MTTLCTANQQDSSISASACVSGLKRLTVKGQDAQRLPTSYPVEFGRKRSVIETGDAERSIVASDGNSSMRQAVRNLLAGLSNQFSKVLGYYRTRRQQKIDRDAFSHMLSLSDELLDDVGVTRDAVRWAAQLPLEVDASKALREVAQGGSSVGYWV